MAAEWHPETKAISDQVIDELYMTAERKRVPAVHLEILRRLAEVNRFRAEPDGSPFRAENGLS